MESSGPTLQASTKSGAAELQAFLAQLTESDLSRLVDGQWTVSAILAHLAFWDRWVENRWQLFEKAGVLDDLPDTIVDLINATALPQWLALSRSSARELAATASLSVSETIQRLDARSVAMAVETQRSHMLDRTRHWNSHIGDVRRSLDRLA